MAHEYYEVLRAVVWRNVITGATASIYGAVPWTSAADRDAWTLHEAGWTVRNPVTGRVGIGRAPCQTFAEANALALRLGRPSRSAIGD